jgi:glucose/arabinose dehydrogenase
MKRSISGISLPMDFLDVSSLCAAGRYTANAPLPAIRVGAVLAVGTSRGSGTMHDNRATAKIPRLRQCGASAVIAMALAIGLSAPANAAALATAVSIGTFDHPLYIAVAPGEPSLLFVVEQPGRVQVLRDEMQLDQPFLDISTIVNFDGDERGLLSIAFAPDYQTSGRFYAVFNNRSGDIEVDEFQRSASNAARADRSSRRKILTIGHRGAANHNGGQLQFGPTDGLLYISTGDGGDLSPRGWPARDLHRLLGKILRINPLPSGDSPYTIPPDNPFLDRNAKPEIYAYGFRNPWRFSFDGKNMIIADVGQSMEEEINYRRTTDVGGRNFGWPQYEGDMLFDNSQPGQDPPTFPIFTYDHSGGRCAIIGGYVAHDPNLPALEGRYLYGDLCTGEIRMLRANVTTQTAHSRAIGVTLPNLSSFGQGFGGVIYAAQIDGGVWRLAPAE